MALYKVDSNTADLTKVAGGTLYADLPIGSWIKNDMATIPSGFLKVGDTISQSEYPELYTKYGSTVPYRADTSELSEYENFTITTSNKEVNYDGILIVNFNPSSSTQLLNATVFVNNVAIGNVSSSNGQQQAITVEVKRGDNVKYDGSNTGTVTGKIAYYKKSLIVKAKQVAVPTDFLDAVDDIIKDTTIDAVTNGDMNPITSNAVYNEFKRVQSQTYECYGYLINSVAGEIEGYGRATVTLKDGVAEIKFSARIHANTMSSTFRWGLNRDLLRTLLPNLPNITPIGNYSNLQFFAGTGAVLVDLMGYGAMASADNQFWVPSRMYQINGSTGVWGSDQFPVNSYITGTVYGIYTV